MTSRAMMRTMLSYALVAARPGHRVPPWVVEILSDCRPADIAFEVETHLHWSDDAGRTHFGGWQHGSDALAFGSHWAVRPEGLTAFSGHIWRRGSAWGRATSWSEQLAEHFAREPLQASLEDYQGVYTAVSMSGNGDGCVAADPLGFGALYRAESEDLVVVSSLSALAARLVTPPGHRSTRDVEALASLAYCGFILGDRTGFDGVTTVPPGTCVDFSATAPPEQRTWSVHPWLPPGGRSVEDLPDLVDEVRADLTATIRAYAEVPVANKLASLTGGKDSRLVLALLISEGLADRFTYTTYGSPSLPDCVVASELTERFGLRHRRSGPPPATGAAAPVQPSTPRAPGTELDTPPTYEELLRRHVWVTSGLLSTWDLRTPVPPRPRNMVLTGLLSLREIYDEDSKGATMEELIDETGKHFDPARIFKPEARQHFEALVAGTLGALQPEDGSPLDAIDAFYVSGNYRRWFGPQPDTDFHDRVYPLYTLRGIRAGFALGGEARRNEILPFELMRTTCPELATTPFSSGAWPEAAVRQLPGAGRPRRRRRRLALRRRAQALTGVKPVQSANQEEQASIMANQVEVLRAQLDIGAEHQLFTFIDRSALLASLDRFGRLSTKARRSVHGAITAAVWLSGAETRPPPRNDAG